LTHTLTKKVALLLDDAQNQYQQLLVREAALWAPRCGLDVLPAEFAGGSSWAQLESIQSWLRQPARPDGAMVMMAGGQLASSAFARLARAGMPVVFLNRMPPWLPDLRAEFPSALLAGVAPRQEGIGEVQGRHALNLAQPGAFVILVTLVTGETRSQAAVDRQRGFEAMVGSRFELEVLEGRWSLEGAAHAMADWLRMGARRQMPIDLDVCQNDTMAAGVRRALGEHVLGLGRAVAHGAPGGDAVPQPRRGRELARERWSTPRASAGIASSSCSDRARWASSIAAATRGSTGTWRSRSCGASRSTRRAMRSS
jgi:ABC-type sugar transport system substrate-binding protein